MHDETTSNVLKPRGRRDKDMSFKVGDDFHFDFKVTASELGWSMNDLLYASFRLFKEIEYPLPKRKRL